MMSTLLAMSRVWPGREAAYEAWYRGRHMPDLMRVPGVVTGEFYRLAAPDPHARWSHAGRYRLDRPIAEVMADILARIGTDNMPRTEAIDREQVLMLGATPTPPTDDLTIDPNARLFVVLSNPVQGDGQGHDANVGNGVLAAQHFTLAPICGGKPSPWRRLDLYETAADRPVPTLAPNLAPNSAADDLYAALFEPAR